MPTIDLTDDELAALIPAARRTIDGDRYPRSPRLAPLRSALAKLDRGVGAAKARRVVAKAIGATRRPGRYSRR